MTNETKDSLEQSLHQILVDTSNAVGALHRGDKKKLLQHLELIYQQVNSAKLTLDFEGNDVAYQFVKERSNQTR